MSTSRPVVYKVSLAIFLFAAGLFISFKTGDDFAGLIKGLFHHLSGKKIQYRSEIISALPPLHYYVLFAAGFVLFCFTKFRMLPKLIIWFVLLEIILFYMVLIGLSWIISVSMITSCTSCHDGFLWLYGSDLPYTVIILCSLAIALAPSAIYPWIMKRTSSAVEL